MVGKYNDEMADNISIVCDGGIDFNVPPLPPQSKVSLIMCISSILFIVILFSIHF